MAVVSQLPKALEELSQLPKVLEEVVKIRTPTALIGKDKVIVPTHNINNTWEITAANHAVGIYYDKIVKSYKETFLDLRILSLNFESFGGDILT